MASNMVYNEYKTAALGAGADLDDNVVKVMLVNGYDPVITHSTLSAITNEVTAAPEYDAGGAILANVAVYTDLATSAARLSGDNITWGGSTIDATGAVIYDSTNNVLVAYIDFGGLKSSTAGDFTIQWNANGIIQLT
jgi:hypothetical protein